MPGAWLRPSQEGSACQQTRHVRLDCVVNRVCAVCRPTEGDLLAYLLFVCLWVWVFFLMCFRVWLYDFKQAMNMCDITTVEIFLLYCCYYYYCYSFISGISSILVVVVSLLIIKCMIGVVPVNSPSSLWLMGFRCQWPLPQRHISPLTLVPLRDVPSYWCVQFCSTVSTMWPFLHRPPANGIQSSGGLVHNSADVVLWYGLHGWTIRPPLQVETEEGRTTRLLTRITADKHVHNSGQNTHTQGHLSHWARTPNSQWDFCYQQQQRLFTPACNQSRPPIGWEQGPFPLPFTRSRSVPPSLQIK